MARQLLKEFGEFYPFAFGIDKEDKVCSIGTYFGKEKPPSSEVLEHLEKGIKSEISKGNYITIALCIDVVTTPPDSSEKTDALEIRVDGDDIKPVNYYLPYSKQVDGEIIFKKMFALKGTMNLFESKEN